MNEAVIKNMLENEDIRKGAYSFIGDTNITYADINILIQQLQTYKDKEDKLRELVKDKLDEQTKTYQKILNEQQNEIDQLERNCDVFYEQMNDAVERTVELNKILDEISNNLHFRYSDAILGKHGTELKNRLLKILERLG